MTLFEAPIEFTLPFELKTPLTVVQRDDEISDSMTEDIKNIVIQGLKKEDGDAFIDFVSKEIIEKMLIPHPQNSAFVD